jgi:hypothetical protein
VIPLLLFAAGAVSLLNLGDAFAYSREPLTYNKAAARAAGNMGVAEQMLTN